MPARKKKTARKKKSARKKSAARKKKTTRKKTATQKAKKRAKKAVGEVAETVASLRTAAKSFASRLLQ